MNFSFVSEVRAIDCFWSTMRHTYRSLAGVINIVFTFAMFALAVAFLGKAKPLETFFILLGCMWFTVIQPIAIYLHHKKLLRNMPKDLTLNFDTKGMNVRLDGKSEDIPWNKMAKIAIEPGMIIIYSDAKHGYMLTNRNLGERRTDFIEFLKKNTKIV